MISCWDMISQELINGAADLQGSKRLFLIFHSGLDTLTIVCVNILTVACCKLCFCYVCLEKDAVPLPATKQVIFNCNTQTILSLLPINF